LSALHCAAAVIGLSADGAGFVQITPLGLGHVLPRAGLTKVVHVTLAVATGRGTQDLGLWCLRNGQPGLPQQRINLQSCGIADPSLGPRVATVAQALSLSLQETRSPDI
jgi:hypothetical protein